MKRDPVLDPKEPSVLNDASTARDTGRAHKRTPYTPR